MRSRAISARATFRHSHREGSRAGHLDASTTYALFAPAGTPKDILERLHTEIKKALEDETVQQKLRAAGVTPKIGAPEEITRMLEWRIPQWADVIKSAGIKLAEQRRKQYRPETRINSAIVPYVIAVDIGGTFTDLVACDVETGAVAYTKSPTTYGRLGEAIFDCIRKAALDARDASFVKHGTTLVINALLQRAGAKTALLTTKGFRDVLEIGRGNRTQPFNLRFHREPPLIPRELR